MLSRLNNFTVGVRLRDEQPPVASSFMTTSHDLHGDSAADSVPSNAAHRIAILLYSDDIATRDAVRLAVGRRPARDVEVSTWFECATAAAAIEAVETGQYDLLILDGEATPTGGLGLCRQLKNEIFSCPPVLVLTGRPQDGWLAAWSQADLAVPHPFDPATELGDRSCHRDGVEGVRNSQI